MLAFQLSFISGLMVGIEFPAKENVKAVFDLFIVRLVIWKPTQEDIDEMNKQE